MPLAIDTVAPHHLALRVYDTTVAVHTDEPALLENLRQMYSRFILQAGPIPAGAIACVALTRPAAPWDMPVIMLDNQVYPVHHHDLVWRGYFHGLVMATIFHHVRSHLIFHAGAIAWHNQGIVLVGDSTHGKSTLVLALLQQGYQFLSDDIASLRRHDGMLCAFPRSLWIRSGTLDLLGLPHLRQAHRLWLDKVLVDADELRPHSVQDQAPLRYLFFLAPPDGSPAASSQEIGIVLDHVDETMLDHLRRMEGVQAVEVGTSALAPLRLQTTNTVAVIEQVRALCVAQGVLLLDVIRRPVITPSFEQAPRLTPLPVSAAAIELLRHFQPGHQSAVLQGEMSGLGTRFYLELAALLQNVRCYRLSVGPLPQMMALVRDLVEVPAAQPSALIGKATIP